MMLQLLSGLAVLTAPKPKLECVIREANIPQICLVWYDRKNNKWYDRFLESIPNPLP